MKEKTFIKYSVSVLSFRQYPVAVHSIDCVQFYEHFEQYQLPHSEVPKLFR